LLDTVDELMDATLGSTAAVDVYLDGVNGDDTNPGTGPTKAVQTWARVRELIPNPISNQVVTVHFKGALYDVDERGAGDLTDYRMDGNGRLVLSGDLTQIATGTITDADPDSDNITLEDTSSPFTNAQVGDIIELTSGWLADDRYTIAEVLSNDKVLLDRPALFDEGGIFRWAVGDTFTVYRIATLISDPTDTAIAAVYNSDTDSFISTPLGGNPRQRLQIKNLRIGGGLRASLLLVGVQIDLINVQVHEADSAQAIWLYDVDLFTHNTVARPVSDGSGRYGYAINHARGRARPIDQDVIWSASIASLEFENGAQVQFADDILAQLSVHGSSGRLACSSMRGNVAMVAARDADVDFFNCAEFDPGKLWVTGGKVAVWSGDVSLYSSFAKDSHLVDGGGTSNYGILVKRGALFRYNSSTSDGTGLLITNTTDQGLLIEDSGRVLIEDGDLEISVTAIGIEADACQFAVKAAGRFNVHDCSGDGINLKACTGSLKAYSHDNTGWGFQCLKGSILLDRGNTYASNTAGDENVDADSKFVAV
jgi:hypothetical protein